MSETPISSSFPFTHQYVSIHNSKIAFITSAPSSTPSSGSTALFLHGNPTSSYLWRNVIPHVSSRLRCIAPDLIGMGASDKPSIPYRFADHVRYMEAFIDAVIPSGPIVLVLHDWGSAIGLDWARRNESRVGGLVLMEFIRAFPNWEAFSETARNTFKAFRDPDVGRRMIVEQNAFVEDFLPLRIERGLGEEEMRYYRAPFKDPASREPVLAWPREMPIGGQPADVAQVVEKFHAWLLETDVPKLLFWAEPGGMVSPEKAKWYGEVWKNCVSRGVGPGVHYIQEDNPHYIGKETAEWLENLGGKAKSM